jgi:hypothetical protein
MQSTFTVWTDQHRGVYKQHCSRLKGYQKKKKGEIQLQLDLRGKDARIGSHGLRFSFSFARDE